MALYAIIRMVEEAHELVMTNLNAWPVELYVQKFF